MCRCRKGNRGLVLSVQRKLRITLWVAGSNPAILLSFFAVSNALAKLISSFKVRKEKSTMRGTFVTRKGSFSYTKPFTISAKFKS